MKHTRKILTLLLAMVLLVSCASAAFVDVSPSAYYYEPVQWALENGVTDGVDAQHFAPNAPCTRAQIVAFLWKQAGRPVAENAYNPFADVSETDWFYDAVMWAITEHVTDGVSPTSFAPYKTCTRAEGVTFLYKYKGRPETRGALPFRDVPQGWYYDAVLWAYQNGVTNGTSATTFSPAISFTRAHIITMLYNESHPNPNDGYVSAVYLGVQNYGDVSEKSTFSYRFFVEGTEQTYTIAADGGRYALQNTLKEGYAYLIRVEGSRLTAAVEILPGLRNTVSGSVTALTASAVTVDGETLPMAAETKTWRVSAQAGGAAVIAAKAARGDHVIVRKGPDGTAKAIYILPPVAAYTPPVSGTPGVHTLKNFLATAMEPVGTTLYIYGGGWDWQDVGSAPQAATLGVSSDWVRFYQSQDAGFTYKAADPAKSYYPFRAYNEYYYAGLDCSGYVGWALYNMWNTQSGGTGFVQPASEIARSLSSRGWGTFTRSRTAFRPGDIFSMSGHVWICLGACSDGSMVILHSTPSNSRSGMPGGGVQLGALGSSTSCEAYRLAEQYMAKYYPDWYARYPVALKNPAEYQAIGSGNTGHFSWTVLSDPEGYAVMTAAQILKDLFHEA